MLLNPAPSHFLTEKKYKARKETLRIKLRKAMSQSSLIDKNFISRTYC